MYDIIVGRSEKDRQIYGTKGAVLLGKHYVKMGQITSLSNKLYLDVASSHVVFICGKRGGGKCLHGNSLITLEDGSLVKIKDLEQKDHRVVSLNKDLKIETACKTEFFKRKVNKILRISLQSGKEIELTPEHPLLTVKGWTPATKLNIGSRIATPRIEPVFGNELIPEHELKLFSYIISEGHLNNNFVLFSNADTSLINDFKMAVKDFDKNLEIINHSSASCLRVVSRKQRTTNSAKRDIKGKFLNGSTFDPSSLITFFHEHKLYGKLSKDKFIPDIVFKTTKQNISLFLNRLFCCDGSIYKDINTNTWKISYSSISKTLIQQVHHLLLRFEILSSIRTKKKTDYHQAYEIEIKGENIVNFINEIGFFGLKQKKAQIALKESIYIKRDPNKDTIPKEIWHIYQPKNWADIGRSLDYKYPKAARESQRYSISRQKLMTIARSEESEMLEKLAGSDIFWDEIIAIKEIIGEETVYDISIPKNHNFVANDIIVHNSYTMGVIAEGFSLLEDEIRNNLSIILLDTMGIYWTMRYANKQEADLLDDWKLKPIPVNTVIYTPLKYYEEYKKKGIPTDFPFSLDASELNPEDWCHAFKQGKYSPAGVFISRLVLGLKNENKKFGIEDIIKLIKKDERTNQEIKDAVEGMFIMAKAWGVFSKQPTKITDLAKAGQIVVLDLSCYATMPGGWDVKALVLGVVSQHLFIHRMEHRKKEEFAQVQSALHYFGENAPQKQDMPLVWLVIDEAHEFLPRNEKDANASTEPLVTIMREGRQPGISLILATQQPGKIHTDVMTQSDTVISHRITAKIDVDALGMLMQSYMREGLTVQLDNLPRVKGAAIVFDDTNERMYPMRVRPRFTWHGGSSPIAVPEKKRFTD